MSLKSDLIGIVGAEHVYDDPDNIAKYSGDRSLVAPVSPAVVVSRARLDSVSLSRATSSVHCFWRAKGP